MAFFNIHEIVDLVVITLALGFIFKDFFVQASPSRFKEVDPVAYWRGIKKAGGDGFKTAIMIAGPAVILHEMGHKVVAISLGFSAEFNAAYFWLGLAILLKLMNFGFVFFVPAYVSIIGSMTPMQSAIIAFAGPGVNLILWLSAKGLLRNKRFMKKYKHYRAVLAMTAKINMFLFIFNMLPIPMFDGFQVYSGLWHALF